ncbi:MAG: hypothetical protein RH949_22215 [Coleofasciculus sp. A1-SPW-01]|uniref:hypothetical protein n=1 Tax=Coleofasciculus sp. A1-SPW-01 TaxID=3070819 RepID=UPI0032F9ED93
MPEDESISDPFWENLLEGYTEAVLNEREATKTNIVHLLDEIKLADQNTQRERKEIVANFRPSNEEFSLLEEIELLTVTLRGYANQIQAQGWIINETQVIEQLREIRVFRIPVIVQFYFGSNGKYEQIKGYIRMLDYLRLLMLEYLQYEQVN